MKSMVVLFALAAVACGSYVQVAQPPHHPALVLDPHGRPLDTAEVINARALHLQAKALEGHYAPLAHSVIAPVAHSVVAPTVVAAPAAVSHQSRVDIHSSPAVVSHAIATPFFDHSAHSSLLDHGISGYEHFLKKRSLAHIAYAAPIIAPSAVSHQSRVDIIEKPAVVSHSVVAPVVSHVASPIVALDHSAIVAPVSTHSLLNAPFWGTGLHGHFLKKRSLAYIAYAAPIIAPSAVSLQSRVDVIEKPAIVSHSVIAPAFSHVASPVVALSHSAIAAPVSAHSLLGASIWGTGLHGHLLKKRSLAHFGYAAPIIAPSAVSHQSRVDIIEKPAVVSHSVVAPVLAHAAPVAVAYEAPVVSAPVSYSEQSRVDYVSSSAHISPLAHSAVWAAPAAHLSHAGLHHTSHW